MKFSCIKTLALMLPFFVIPYVNARATKEPAKERIELPAKEIRKKSLEDLKNTVVTISIHETESAFQQPYHIYGTGFIVDLAKGILVTNRHIASVDTPASYEAEFYDGTILEANFIWNHPTNDFAFLKVDPKKIPENVDQVQFSDARPGEEITIIGNNNASGYSVQTGQIIDLFSITGPVFPSHSLSMSLNTRGGSSGSPIFNQNGQVIALHKSGNDTTGFSIPISYIKDALKYLLQQEVPRCISTGAVLSHNALDNLSLYYKYPRQENMKEFLKKIPDSRNRMLCVESILPGTPAATLLEPGDIIEAVNGERVGPNLYQLDTLMPKNTGGMVKFTVVRNGQTLNVNVPTVDLNERQCSTFAKVGNAIFATITPIESYITGMPMGSVCMMRNTAGSLFEQLPRIPFPEDKPQVRLTKINGYPIGNLEDFIRVIPGALAQKHFNYHIRNYGFEFRDTNTWKTHQHELSQYTKYDPNQYDSPVIISFNPHTYNWERKPLLIPVGVQATSCCRVATTPVLLPPDI